VSVDDGIGSWVDIAKHDTDMREGLRHVATLEPGLSALDVLDGLLRTIADLKEAAERERSGAAMTEAAARIRGRRWP
jgi:hypothetical protein